MGLLEDLVSLFLPSPKQYGTLSVTLRGEQVKSHAEQKIADFLSRNGIRYEYERPFEVGIWIFNKELCKPDFYLPDYDVYVEYWGLKDIGEKYKRRDYRAKMAWKMEQYERYGVKLIAIYPDNIKNLDWIFRKRFAEVSGQELPRRSGPSGPKAQAGDMAASPPRRARPPLLENDKSNEPSPPCPKCGSKMVMRRAKRGSNAGKPFWGCSQWPKTKCPGIINIR